eukprot:GFUD01025176.1.p1 GENE.GFUD01025176.1~~GFUD01025176.1.p1  ORF type:complete len:342 (-),score=127.70 GFUD01025176.1:42-1067(-)
MGDSQILEHSSTLVNYTLFDVNWVPSSPRLVVCGSTLAGEGTLRVYSLAGQGLSEVGSATRTKAVRCGTFRSSSLEERLFCTGDFGGNVAVWDLEELSEPVEEVVGHTDMINCITGSQGDGGQLVTGSRDGLVKVWDRRNLRTSTVTMEGDEKRDCWAVTTLESGEFVAAGYSNGDVRVFDIRAGKVFWETSLPQGVTSLQFSGSKGEKLDRLVAGSLGGGVAVWDMQTRHKVQGYTRSDFRLEKTTVWGASMAPQDKGLMLATLGSGAVQLVRFKEPGHRVMIGGDGANVGTPGEFLKVSAKQLTDKPVTSSDWSQDRAGLVVTTSFDQNIRILIVTGVK